MLFTMTPLMALGPPFSRPVPTEPLPHPHWIAWNASLAHHMGLPSAPSDDQLRHLSGDITTTHCSVYAGHQFGHWAGQLGDGRAHSLGLSHGWEWQLKGAGRTPYSRRGDGRAVLRSSIREYLASEAMAALGIPTTRALAITGSSLPVWRETVETAAIVTRLAPSFLRFGHFEHFMAQGDEQALSRLVQLALDVGYPHLRDSPNPALALLDQVTQRTAQLVARWQAVGFCHGVLNTDNMSILGLTLDYGPFGFMDQFSLSHICNHSDTQGRYAYHQQPTIGLWNCAALASSLMPLIKDESAIEKILDAYVPHYQSTWLALFRAKLGLSSTHSEDGVLITNLLTLLDEHRLDFTQFFRSLSDNPLAPPPTWADTPASRTWWARYAHRRQQETIPTDLSRRQMKQTNPKYVLRNYLAERAIRDAEQGNFATLATLKEVLDQPFDEHPDHALWAEPPPPGAETMAVSCSS